MFAVMVVSTAVLGTSAMLILAMRRGATLFSFLVKASLILEAFALSANTFGELRTVHKIIITILQNTFLASLSQCYSLHLHAVFGCNVLAHLIPQHNTGHIKN